LKLTTAVLAAACIFSAGQAMTREPEQVAGSEWRPAELCGVTVPADTDIFLQFQNNGRVIGHGGCNRFNGGYTIDKAAIRIGPLMSTRRACALDVMQREQDFLQGLERAKLFLRNGARLTLKDAQGVTTLRLVQRDSE